MIDGYKVVVVVPAGRKPYLELLAAYLRDHKDIVDVCRLWVNTTIQSDINYMKKLALDPFFQLEYPQFKVGANVIASIHQFFRNCISEDTIYIRFDDDICYIAPDAIVNLLNYRLENQKPYLVYPNIINNSMNVCFDNAYFDIKDWFRSDTIIQKHEHFLSNRNLNFKVKHYVNENYFRFNINCICWFGWEFAKFGGIVDADEEPWLAIIKPKSIGNPTEVCGDSVIVHYAFRPQNVYLEKTNLFQRYRDLKIKRNKMI